LFQCSLRGSAILGFGLTFGLLDCADLKALHKLHDLFTTAVRKSPKGFFVSHMQRMHSLMQLTRFEPGDFPGTSPSALLRASFVQVSVSMLKCSKQASHQPLPCVE